jgi:hypothetical protein
MASSYADRFGVASGGIQWAVGQLSGGQVRPEGFFAGEVEVKLAPLAGALGEDDYSITFAGLTRPGKAVRTSSQPGKAVPPNVTVAANTAVGTISGILELGKMLTERKRKNLVKHLQFRTRNYKHEVTLAADEPRSLEHYTDELWESLCQHIVSHQFNGLTLYPENYHPFDEILDYKEWPQAAWRPKAHCDANRERLNAGLAIAHKYGLKTFMQHYVSHFTPALLDYLKLGSAAGDRLSTLDHPVIDDYCRWCYREIIKQCPDLDGLYFNYESAPSGAEHVLRTMIPEWNAMKKKPIALFRLWGVTEPSGMQKIYKAYKGRFIVSHKVSDTNDTYYLPVADSRVMEWKKLLPGVEFSFCIGPCHNCGTNLQGQLWSDYDYVQTLIADAKKKGADSFSFHTVNDFFSPLLPGGEKIFSQKERDLARFNVLHMLAVSDYVNGVSRNEGQRVSVMAKSAGVSKAAGKALASAIHASSQCVLLGYQQFCYGSNYDGFIHPGRYSHIQEPFFYYPATALNNQGSGLMWKSFAQTAWIKKTIDTKVAPDNLLQYIIDYVDPSKPKAVKNPKKIAALLAKNMKAADKALARYKALAGKEKGEALAWYIKMNACMGGYFEYQIRAAIELYSMYFATSKAAMVSKLRKGIAYLDKLPALVKDGAVASDMVRVTMFNCFKPQEEAKWARELLAAIESEKFPMAALVSFIQSHKHYNEIRRIIRPYRQNVAEVMDYAQEQLCKSIAASQKCLAHLQGWRDESFARNVRGWLEFVQEELAFSKPPRLVVTDKPSPEQALKRNHCFRTGEHFLDDFLGFFRPIEYIPGGDQHMRVWRGKDELIIEMGERGVDMAARLARWKKFEGGGSAQYVTQAFIDATGKGSGKGQGWETFIIWPMGHGVSQGLKPLVKAETEFVHDETSWHVKAHLPFSLIGAVPKKGQTWGLNVNCGPAITSLRNFQWAPQYESCTPRLFGKIKFE